MHLPYSCFAGPGLAAEQHATRHRLLCLWGVTEEGAYFRWLRFPLYSIALHGDEANGGASKTVCV